MTEALDDQARFTYSIHLGREHPFALDNPMSWRDVLAKDFVPCAVLKKRAVSFLDRRPPYHALWTRYGLLEGLWVAVCGGG